MTSMWLRNERDCMRESSGGRQRIPQSHSLVMNYSRAMQPTAECLTAQANKCPQIQCTRRIPLPTAPRGGRGADQSSPAQTKAFALVVTLFATWRECKPTQIGL